MRRAKNAWRRRQCTAGGSDCARNVDSGPNHQRVITNNHKVRNRRHVRHMQIHISHSASRDRIHKGGLSQFSSVCSTANRIQTDGKRNSAHLDLPPATALHLNSRCTSQQCTPGSKVCCARLPREIEYKRQRFWDHLETHHEKRLAARMPLETLPASVPQQLVWRIDAAQISRWFTRTVPEPGHETNLLDRSPDVTTASKPVNIVVTLSACPARGKYKPTLVAEHYAHETPLALREDLQFIVCAHHSDATRAWRSSRPHCGRSCPAASFLDLLHRLQPESAVDGGSKLT